MEEIIRFHATWCGPCKMVAPVVEKISMTTGIPVTDVDVDEEPAHAVQYQVQSVPTIIKLVDGVEVKRVVGAKPYAALRTALDV